ncbi:MAG: putative RNA methyltransferase [Nitriliruptoraceae bacterium]
MAASPGPHRRLPAEVVAALACPHDAGPLTQDDTGLICPAGHRFDRARQGHVTLTAGPLRHAGDTADQVARRLAVHREGVLRAVHAAVVAEAMAAPLPGGLVADLGAGPGTYLAAVLDALPARAGLAVDVSKAAARRAARCHPRAGAVVADVWDRIPVRDRAAALVLLVFAPRSGGEPARLLADGGAVVVVTPGPDHLAELRERTPALRQAPDKLADVAAALGPDLHPAPVRHITDRRRVPRHVAVDLVAMGPSGHHLDARDLDRVAEALPAGIEVSVDVRVQRWQRAPLTPGAPNDAG